MTVNLSPPLFEAGGNVVMERALDDDPERKTLARTQEALPNGRLRSANSLIRKAPNAANAPNAGLRGRSILGGGE
ncbi:MAG: hypothetical protein AB7U95_23645 [Reyranella sp.]